MPQYMMGSQHLTTTNNHKWGTKESNRQLSLELHQFGAYVSEVDEQSRSVIDHMITLLQKAVTKACPGALFESYGLYATGLWLPTSDVDMVVHLPVQLYDANHGNIVNESSKRGTSEENDGTQKTVSGVANGGGGAVSYDHTATNINATSADAAGVDGTRDPDIMLKTAFAAFQSIAAGLKQQPWTAEVMSITSSKCP